LGGGVNMAKWLWEFGDNNTSQLQNPSHYYLAPGTYITTLLVQNENSCKDSITRPINVMELPKVNFDYTKPACLNVPVSFNNNSSNAQSYIWNFGDGNISTLSEPNHIYLKEGLYQIKLTARSGFGCTYSDSSEITITGPPPRPYFQISKKEGCSPVTSYISIDSSRYDQTSSYYWDFGNGLTSNSLIPPDSLFYKGSLTDDTVFHIRFVSYNFCDSLVYSESILVHPQPLTQFEMIHDWDCTPVEVHLKNVSRGKPESFYWDLGDGTTSTEFEPLHTYTTGVSSSIYQISLISRNKCGIDTLTRNLLIKPNTVDAFFTVNNFKGCEGDAFCFQNYSSDTSGVGISNLSWNFGDGQGSSAENPCHVFKQVGIYTVKLQVDNGCGRDETYDTIVINPTPLIEIHVNNEACVGEALSFNFSTNVEIAGKKWYFGDGDSSLLSNPYHSYKQAGTYEVMLTGVSVNGFPACVGVVNKQVVIKPTPDSFILSDTSGCAPLEITFQGDPGSNHVWNFGDNTPITTNPTHVFNSPGLFMVKLISQNSSMCRDSDSVEIRVFPSPESQFTFTSSGGYPEYLTFVNSSTGATECFWDFDNGHVLPSCEVNGPIEYRYNDNYIITLQTLNEYGCEDTHAESYLINFKGLFVPNALIPEAPDPDENLFLPKGIGIMEYTIQIYDTWGNLIWQSSALEDGMPSEGWNGRDKDGKLYPQDVYVWRASAKFTDGTNWSGKNGETYGTVTLIR
jgi:PKD repeat protein